MMMPGLVTIFLFQFVAVWNNFLLPFIMLSDENKFPLTVGLYTLLNRGSTAPALYSLVVTGSLLSIIPLIDLVPRAAAVLAHRPRVRRGQAVTELAVETEV